MALPRKLVNALRSGTYKVSASGKKAREAAAKIRDERENPPQEIEPPQRQSPRDTFVSTKDRMARAKFRAFYGTRGFDPTESERSVFGSDATEIMEDLLAEGGDYKQLASLAGRAHAALAKTGSAGDLEEYLDYDFLFYHL